MRGRRWLGLTAAAVAVAGLGVGPVAAKDVAAPDFERRGTDNTTDFGVLRIRGGIFAAGFEEYPLEWHWRFSDGVNDSGVTDVWGNTGGTFSDIPVPGDYDGDGRSDPAIWREPALNGDLGAKGIVLPPSPPGVFWIHNTSNGTATVLPWGMPGDTPLVIGDYDGDGRQDPAVYRAGSPASEWWVHTSGPGPDIAGFPWGDGGLGDIAAPADYDGDGRTDVAVIRPTSEDVYTFIIHKSSDGGVMIQNWGSPAEDDIFLPGDYDGDGKADFAVARRVSETTIMWFILGSTGSVQVVPFGFAIFDIPVIGDFDGDGRNDIAVYRLGKPGVLLFVRSSHATGAMSSIIWGEINQEFVDIPISTVYLRGEFFIFLSQNQRLQEVGGVDAVGALTD